MAKRLRRPGWLFACALLLCGCPPKQGDEQQPQPAKVCTRIGDMCEYQPGKLGVCVAPEGCTQSRCLLCQSQH